MKSSYELVFSSFQCSFIYPGSTPTRVFADVPFTLTTADVHDIDSWDDILRTAPQHGYVTKHLVGIPTRVDTVEADPVCPYCASPTNNEMDESTYFCSERCPASCDTENFQPIIEVTSSFRMDIEGARKSLIEFPLTNGLESRRRLVDIFYLNSYLNRISSCQLDQ